MTTDPPQPPQGLGRTELQSGAIRGALWTALHVTLSLPLAFIVNIFLARVLGVVDYGRLGFLTTVMSLAMAAATLGAGTALVQFGSSAHADGEPGEVRKFLRGTQGYQLMVVAPVVTLVVIALVDVSTWLLVTAIVAGVALPAVLSVAQSLLAIESRSDRNAQVAIVTNLGAQGAVVVAVLTAGTADAVWSARVIATGLLLFVPVLLVSPAYRRAIARPLPPWRLPRRFWAFAIPTGVAGLVSTLVVERTEVLFLEWLGDPIALGLFSLAFGLAGHVYAPAVAFLGPLLPALSGLRAVDPDRMAGAFLRSTRVSSVIAGLFLATALPALAALVPVLYGSEYSAAANYFIVLGGVGAVSLAGSPHYAFLMARLGGTQYLWINGLALAVKLVAAIALIPLWGAWGAVFANGVGVLTRALVITSLEYRNLGFEFQEVLSTMAPLGLAGLWLAIGWGTATQIVAAPLVEAVGLSVAGAMAYVALLTITHTGLTHGDVRAIRTALPRVLDRIARIPLAALAGRQG